MSGHYPDRSVWDAWPEGTRDDVLVTRPSGRPRWKPHPSCSLLDELTPELRIAWPSGVKFPGNF
jgi:hypothetical protein